MIKTPDPTNFIASREHYQICKYKLLRSEEELLKSFEVKKIADLETAMVHERSRKHPRFQELSRLYNQQHNELDAADRIFEAACEIQKQRLQLEAVHKNLDE